MIWISRRSRASPPRTTCTLRKSRRPIMVIGVALIGVITVALVDAFIAVIITTKEIMRASPRHSRQAFQADRQCGDVGKRRALAALRPTRAPSHRRRRAVFQSPLRHG